MSFADEDEFDAFAHGEHHFPSLNGEALARKFKELKLKLQPEKGFDWLARASSRVLFTTIPNSGEGPDRQSNAAVRNELLRRCQIAQSAWIDLFEHDQGVDSKLFDFAWDAWDGAEDEECIVTEPPLYARYHAAIRELDWLGSILRDAAKSVEEQTRKWSSTEQLQLRIERARHLAPLYQLAFGEQPTSNNAPTADWHNSPTQFALFYQSVMALAFDESAVPNLPHVLKTALALHRDGEVQFAEGIIPDA